MSVTGDFIVAVVGDIVQTRPLAKLADKAVQQAIAPLRDADLAIGNLEQTIADWRQFDGHHYGVNAFLIMAAPEIADDLADMGFRVLCRANNRLFDFGAAGNRETDAHLRRVGITPVGYGEHLAEARAPAYHDLPKGRVSATGVTSSVNHDQHQIFGSAARIANSNGRPGANNLRVSRTITLPPKQWEQLAELVRSAAYAFPGPFAIMPTVMVWEDRIRLGNEWYEPGEEAGYTYEVHPDDMADVLKHVRNAAVFSNFNVLSIHSHQWMIDPENPVGGIAGETSRPPDFLVDLAHGVIDSGSDMFCVHGPFDFRAIEIYRGKPVFYGLGPFIRQAYMQEIVPWETYRRFQFGEQEFDLVNPYTTNIPDAHLLLTRTAKHPARYFEGATASCTYRDSQLREILLHPVDLGFDGPLSDLGTPRAAGKEPAERILQRIAENSARFGTQVEIRNGLGVISIKANEAMSTPVVHQGTEHHDHEDNEESNERSSQ